MLVKKELTFNEMTDFLWGPALELWLKASDEQRQTVWDMLEDAFYNEVPDATLVNDFVAFNCNDIFFPEEAEEYEESLKRNKKLESRIKRLEKLMFRK